MTREERKNAMKIYIVGLLFEFDIPQEEKQEISSKITTDIFGYTISNDRHTFQKMALGYLSEFADKIEKSQMISISQKIAFF